jgi:peptide-methionine (S)-S-oxide reductase
LGDHSETVQIDYDPAQISYEELLDIFWASHNPTGQTWSRQYMSIIFYHDERQKELALASRERQAARLGRPIATEIVPFTAFYLAEGYHQKYWLRQKADFEQAFKAIYPDGDDLVASTAAARVNGYLGGYGSFDALQAEVDSLGLPPALAKKLLDTMRRRT